MASLKSEMLNGVFWSAIEKYSGMLVSFIVSAILARLISPKDFGIVAVAMVIINFLQMFSTMGIGPAIIQRKDLESDEINIIYTCTFLGGIVLSTLLFVLSWPIARFYENDILTVICQVLTVQFFFSSVNIVPNALMSRDKRFREIAKRTLCFRLFSGVCAVLAAYNGSGIYSLLISPVITSIGIFLYNKRMYSLKVIRKLSLEPLKKIYQFSLYQFLFEFFNYFARNLDKLIIGKYINMNDLGYYEKSYRLMQMPMNSVTTVINPVLQPVLSTLQSDKEELSIKYNKITRFVSFVSFPIGALLFLCSRECILIVFGDQWTNAIPSFTALTLSLPIQMILSTSGSIYLAANDSKHLFYSGFRNSITTILGLIFALLFFHTIEAVAWSYTITLLINFFRSSYILYHQVLKTNIGDMLNLLIAPFVLFVILLVLGYILNVFLGVYDNIYVSFFIKVIFVIFLSLSFIQVGGYFNLISLIRKKKE